MTDKKTPGEVADLIERFLSGTERHPQEFNDFLDCGHPDPEVDAYRERCEILHCEFGAGRGNPLTLLGLQDREMQDRREQAATEELQQIAAELRSLDARRRRLPA